MKFEDLLGTSADSAGRAPSYFRKVAKETDNDLVRALRILFAKIICVAIRILFAPNY